MSTRQAGKRSCKPTLESLMDASLLADGDKIICRTKQGRLTKEGAIDFGGKFFASVSQFAHFCGVPSSVNGWKWCVVQSSGEDTGRCLQDVRESAETAQTGECGLRGEDRQAKGGPSKSAAKHEIRAQDLGAGDSDTAARATGPASGEAHKGGARQVGFCEGSRQRRV